MDKGRDDIQLELLTTLSRRLDAMEKALGVIAKIIGADTSTLPRVLIGLQMFEKMARQSNCHAAEIDTYARLAEWLQLGGMGDLPPSAKRS